MSDQYYCLDSGVFINSWTRHYPIDIFPTLWGLLREICDNGTAIIPKEVYKEIERGGDELLTWVKEVKSSVESPNKAIVSSQRDIVQAFPRLVHAKGTRSGADPWVIAHAQCAKATVVTEEQNSANPDREPKIPDVCSALDIPCIKTVDMLRELGLSL